MASATATFWTTAFRRTNFPKLEYLIQRLKDAGVPCRLNGESAHAPILEVPEECADTAWDLLSEKFGDLTLDDAEDDHPHFTKFGSVRP